MLSISPSTRTANGFDVRIYEPGTGWRGFTVVAYDVAEAHEAIDHYYNPAKHTHQPQKCPLCRRCDKHTPDTHAGAVKKAGAR